MDFVWEQRDVILRGFGTTVLLAVSSGLLAFIFGTLLAVMRVGPVPPLRWAGSAYVTVVRNTPLTLVFVFCTFGLPRMEVRLAFVTFAIIALTVYTSAFVCEAVRSGINSVEAGEIEAARAVGLPFHQILSLVVLPQAFRAVIPPLGSVYNALVKNTSVAVAFSVAEASSIFRRLANDDASATWSLLLTTAVGYMVLAAVVFAAARILERSTAIVR